MIEINESKQKLTIDEIYRVEKKFGIQLPEGYRDFLLSHNGGFPINPKFKFRLPSGRFSDSLVNRFLAIYDGEYSNFETFFSDYKQHQNRIPAELVPIAYDPFGNLVCIGVSGVMLGEVFFWDHENEKDDGSPPGFGNVHLIARTFTEFLNCLEPL